MSWRLLTQTPIWESTKYTGHVDLTECSVCVCVCVCVCVYVGCVHLAALIDLVRLMFYPPRCDDDDDDDDASCPALP